MPVLSDTTDLQATAPAVPLALDEVGITGVVRGILLGAGGIPTTATIDVRTSLDARSRGAHMSRFHEAIDHALTIVGDEGNDVPSLEILAMVIATRAAALQETRAATVTVRATLAWPRITPASGRRTVDPVDVWARVDVDRETTTTHTTLGVSATGMTACPCAQHMVRDAGVARMRADGLDDATIERALAALPVATHNQRSTGSLEVTVPGDGAVTAIADPIELSDLVRNSMSAGIHELLKRGDELAVVEAAHDDPRFVEDCVRALLRDAAAHPALADLPGATVLSARQLNHESIHAHDVVAARAGTLDSLRAELATLRVV